MAQRELVCPTVVFGKHKVAGSERVLPPVFIVTVDATSDSCGCRSSADIDHESDQVP